MKSISWLLLPLLLSASPARAQTPTAPLGKWDTISDTDGKPAATVEIRRAGDHYVGIITALLRPDDDPAAVCDKCRDERKGQPVVGMEIIRGIRADGNGWSGGQILDPETGKTYKATMHLGDDGNTLIVRGYIGLPMFGRSQTWVRHRD
jgi:uncharacterized protein (DUF2147 family)